MKQIITVLLVCLLTAFGHAQIQHNGMPEHWNSKSIIDENIPFFKTDVLDMVAIVAEDAVVDGYKETPYRFGMDVEVNLNFFDNSISHTNKHGDIIWQMGIHCPNATSINFVFGEFYIPEGSELYVWNADRTEYLGAFTSANIKDFGSLAIGLIHDDKIVIEYSEPAEVAGQALLSISQISHGYRPVLNKWDAEKGPFGSSGTCNMNVNCPDGDDWQEEKRGVALILNGGFAHCTGSLINNTAQDETPYFLTADHCAGGESNWVMYFNHEYDGCTNSGGTNTSQSISGGTASASSAASDVHLVLLSSDVPATYEPYFNGWDNSGSPVPLAIGIHHPSGDVKKISFDDDPLTLTPYLQNNVGSFNHWRIEAWERNTTTEGGSSGSPLFDQNHRIIGQLHGGFASCSSTTSDWYGAMHSSWSTLSPFLDPNSSGVATLDGFGPYDTSFANDAQAGSISGFATSGCEVTPFDVMFELKNNGTNPLTTATINYSFNGSAQPAVNWTGSLAQGEFEVLNLESFTPNLGANNITVTVTTSVDDNAGNNEAVSNFNGSSADGSGSGEININIYPDNYGGETTWELINEAGTTVLTGGPYTNGNTTPVSVNYATGSDPGCYEFIIYDAANDGLCCGFGIGSYDLTDINDEVIVSGAEFGGEESKLISMNISSSIDENDFSKGISIYPNPTQDILNISLADNRDYQYEIFNVVGELILSDFSYGDQKLQLNVSDYATGMYLIKISSENNVGVKTFVVK